MAFALYFDDNFCIYGRKFMVINFREKKVDIEKISKVVFTLCLKSLQARAVKNAKKYLLFLKTH